MNTNAIAFKRLEIGSNFSRGTQNYRKVHEKGAYALLENGRGQTHKRITFARSTLVTPA